MLLFPGTGPAGAAVGWGALSGVGSAVGTLALYHGLAVGRMTVVATLSAVLTAVLPVIAGIALGNHLRPGPIVGIALAIPAIAMVCWQPARHASAPSGARYGALAGLGFALLFIALDRAGTRSGAWPAFSGQVISMALVLPFAYRAVRGTGRPSSRAAGLTLGAGIVSGTANLLFLAATGHGQLAIVSVLTALYPAVTVLMARAFLGELWTRVQAAGLVAALAAVVLVAGG